MSTQSNWRADVSVPKGTISLANLKCRLPKSARKDKPWCFRVDIVMGEEETGHGKYIFATKTEKEMIREYARCLQLYAHLILCLHAVSAWMEVIESASSHTDALGEQLRKRRQLGMADVVLAAMKQTESSSTTPVRQVLRLVLVHKLNFAFQTDQGINDHALLQSETNEASPGGS